MRPPRNHLRHRRDAGKRTASGQSKRSAEPLALPIRARFIPLSGHPVCSSDWCMPRIPGGRFLRRSARAGRQAGLDRTCGRGGLPDQPAPSHRHRGGDLVRAARRRVGRLARCRGERHCAGLDAARAALTNVAGAFPVPFSGLDLTELVVYLSWTDDVLVVDPPYTCAGNAPDHCHQAARSGCSCGERGARTAD